MVKAKRDILNEPFTQEMVNKFESELLRLEKPYFKKLGNSIFTLLIFKAILYYKV